MIVSCPACQTRFHVPANALGKAGRKVRCANCGKTWHQMPIEEAKARAPQPAMEEAIPGPHDKFLQGDSGDDVYEFGDEELEKPAANETSRQKSTTIETSTNSDKALPEHKEENTGDGHGLVGWLVLIMMLGGLGGGGYWYQAKIVEIWPPAGQLYEMLGLGPVVEQVGLAIRNVKWEHIRRDGKPVLVVRGEVTNTSQTQRSVPRLLVVILDGRDRRLFRWTAATVKDKLDPGQVAKFLTQLANPPDGARSLAVTFQVQQ